MAHEIEKKYLLLNDEWEALPVKERFYIAQGYIEGKALDISFKFNDKNEAVFSFLDTNAENDTPLSLTINYNSKSGFAGFIGLSQIDLDTGKLSIRDGLVCRIRLRESLTTGKNEAFLTIKASTDNPDISDEYEELIDLDDAKAILNKFGSHIVEKQRNVVPVGDFNWEVDIFQNTLKGLKMAEIEVDNENDFNAVSPLPGLGKDVTSDNRYKNRALGEFGIPKP